MPKRPPPKEKTNVGSLLPETAVAGLLRALRGVRPAPHRTVVRFDAPSEGSSGPTRYFSPEAILELAQRLERLAAGGKKSRIAVTPETANLWAKALRAYAARPDENEILEAVCANKNCPIRKTCYACRAKANLMVQIFEGRANFSRALKRER